MHPLLPWILAALSVALLLGAGGLALFKARRRSELKLPSEWALSPRPVFGSDERRAYRQLRDALPQHIVLAKLPLVRFCQPSDPQQLRYWHQLLGAIHVSFAICSASGRVLAVVDLDDRRAGSQRSLKIKQSVLDACRVRYLRCAADRLPSIAELQALVPQHADASRAQQPAPTLATARGGPSARRPEQATLWRESGYLQDSIFGPDSILDPDAPSGFGALRRGVSVRELAPPADDVGGAVVDAPASKLRH